MTIPDIPDAIDPFVWIFLGLVFAAGIYNLYRNRQRKDALGDWRDMYLREGIGGSPIALLRYRTKDYPDEAWVKDHADTLSWIWGEAWPTIARSWEPAVPVRGDRISLVECYPRQIQLKDGTYADGVTFTGIGGAKILVRTYESPLDGGAFAHELVHVGQWYLARAGTDHEPWLPIHHQIAETYRTRS